MKEFYFLIVLTNFSFIIMAEFAMLTYLRHEPGIRFPILALTVVLAYIQGRQKRQNEPKSSYQQNFSALVWATLLNLIFIQTFIPGMWGRLDWPTVDKVVLLLIPIGIQFAVCAQLFFGTEPEVDSPVVHTTG